MAAMESGRFATGLSSDRYVGALVKGAVWAPVVMHFAPALLAATCWQANRFVALLSKHTCRLQNDAAAQ